MANVSFTQLSFTRRPNIHSHYDLAFIHALIVSVRSHDELSFVYTASNSCWLLDSRLVSCPRSLAVCWVFSLGCFGCAVDLLLSFAQVIPSPCTTSICLQHHAQFSHPHPRPPTQNRTEKYSIRFLERSFVPSLITTR